MGNFEKLSVLVIVVIIVMILVVALYTWTGDPSGGDTAVANVAGSQDVARVEFPAPPKPIVRQDGGMADVPGFKPLKVEDIIKMVNDPKPTGEQPVAPVADVPPAAPKEPRVHVVVAGETVGKIAKIEYPGVSSQRVIDAILKANPTVDPGRLAIGCKLLLPELGADVKPVAVVDSSAKKNPAIEAPVATIKPGTIYVTRKGDTLPGISKRAYRSSDQWHRIWVENFDEISDTEHLTAGMRLRIPRID